MRRQASAEGALCHYTGEAVKGDVQPGSNRQLTAREVRSLRSRIGEVDFVPM